MKPELYAIGDAPPLGVVPQSMYAYTVRRERFGQPKRDDLRFEVLEKAL